MTKFADIVLPLPIQPLTYSIPFAYQARINLGSGVLVPLRSSKLVLGIVVKCHTTRPTYPTKEILGLIYESPLFTAQQLKFLEWLADYYLSNIGSTLSLAWPNLVSTVHNLFFQTKASKTNNDQNQTSLTEQRMLDALACQSLSYQALIQLTDNPKETAKGLISLVSKGLVEAVSATRLDSINDPKDYFTLSSTIGLDYPTIEALAPGSPKQQAILAYFFLKKQESIVYVSKKELATYSKSAFDTLLKKNILIKVNSAVLPSVIFTDPLAPLASLTQCQQNALIAIEKEFRNKSVVLLHGAIGSGKTELYMHLMASALRKQKQVLLLIPEIGLVTHIIERIKPLWGEWLVVYHSKQSHKERLKTWLRILSEPALLVVGTRSALLLPFKQLELIVIDEEHDAAYKQTDTMPNYHARESGIVLAQQHQAKVLLGSGTPSIESYYNTQLGKYSLVTLENRFGRAKEPELFFIDLNIEKKRKAIRDHFSLTLLSEIEKNSIAGGQSMIFQNRRGYAHYFLCAACGWIPRCQNCSVSLTYHQGANHLRCHYCNYTTLPANSCYDCGAQQLQNIGFGTEKLVETLQLIFPTQKISRMDLDSTKGKNSYRSILKGLTDGSIDILVGTQMIAKGLDLPNIRLIGILDIDSLLYFPDFRANEKCFQLITQLAGRAGRRSQQGIVFIQTRQTNHPLFEYLANGDYQGMYRSELKERESFVYPPYIRLVKITLRCTERATLQRGAFVLKEILAKNFQNMVLGPQEPLVNKIKNQFLLDFFVKIDAKNFQDLGKIKKKLVNICYATMSKGAYKAIKTLLDVDPV